MSSGVTVASEAKLAYEEIKKDKKYRYIIYHIKDDKVIDVEATGARDATYSDFLAKLENLGNDCRYCVFDFPSQVSVEGAGQDKTNMSVDRLLMMTWCPENSSVKKKMLYSSSYEALKKALVGVYKYIQANGYDDVAEKTIEDSFRKGK
ncbi:Cofilin/actin-depolymerizing factor -like protein [Halotydeus destructor]|nr:Cofilin/actin-depolymerizing factor -like protein [Halotydeus destructor]